MKNDLKHLLRDSDIISGSASYFKAKGNHYFSPYIYYSRPNYIRLEDYNTKGAGFNNTYVVNEKNNINYGISYSNTSYDQTNTFDAADDKNFENYSSNIYSIIDIIKNRHITNYAIDIRY